MQCLKLSALSALFMWTPSVDTRGLPDTHLVNLEDLQMYDLEENDKLDLADQLILMAEMDDLQEMPFRRFKRRFSRKAAALKRKL